MTLMKAATIVITLIFGLFGICVETRSIKESSLFAWIDSIPFVALCIVTFLLSIITIWKYLKYKKLVLLFPLLFGAASILIIIWHRKARKELDNSPINFTASTYQIGSDGGFVLEFKKNGHLKAERYDHWMVTNYWGKYSYNKDTIELDIPLNFELGRKAIIAGNSLIFMNDTVKFNVFKPIVY